MNKIILKILTPIVLYCFICAFLELDFGLNFEQTWHDEYDTYTLVSGISFTDCHSLSFVYLGDPVLQFQDKLIFPKTKVAGNNTIQFRSSSKDRKVFIKHKAFLI